jgi:hypothetical protein
MDKKRWSDYDRYVVLVDNSRGRIGTGYEKYIKFKLVVEALKRMRNTDGNYVVIDGEVITNKKLTTSEATNILSNIYECKWTPVTEKLLLVASQLGISLH